MEKKFKKIAYTNTRLVGTFKVGPAEYHIDVPRGTRCKRIEVGKTANMWWIDDLSWISSEPEDHMLKHDAYFYGIVISNENVK